MTKTLQFFRWFPADAMTDELYASFTDQELGFFHRCLNHAWLNDGLPPEMGDLARIMGVTPDYLTEVWKRVGIAFVKSRKGGHRLCNSRQEKERDHAMSKSAKAVASVRTRYERNPTTTPNVATRASVSVSVSASVPEGGPGGTEIPIPARPPKEPAKDGFDAWWDAWWNKTAKAAGRKAWQKAAAKHGAEFLLAQVVADRARFEPTATWDWRRNLHPATWLNGERWEDQLPPQANAAVVGGWNKSAVRPLRIEPQPATEQAKREALEWIAENDPDPAAREDAKKRLA